MGKRCRNPAATYTRRNCSRPLSSRRQARCRRRSTRREEVAGPCRSSSKSTRRRAATKAKRSQAASSSWPGTVLLETASIKRRRGTWTSRQIEEQNFGVVHSFEANQRLFRDGSAVAGLKVAAVHPSFA